MKKINWTMVATFAIVVFIVFFVSINLLGGWRYSSWGKIGPGMMGNWGFSPFGLIGMIFMMLIPVGFIVLTVLGVIWLVRAVESGSNPAAHGHTCPSCGRDIQADWRNCPYCGELLKK